MNLNKILYWTPRGLSIFLVFFWLAVIFVYNFGIYHIAGVMVWITLLLVTLLAWKNAPLGGSFFIVLSILYLVFFFENIFSFTSLTFASPFFIIGTLFIADYLFQKKGRN